MRLLLLISGLVFLLCVLSQPASSKPAEERAEVENFDLFSYLVSAFNDELSESVEVEDQDPNANRIKRDTNVELQVEPNVNLEKEEERDSHNSKESSVAKVSKLFQGGSSGHSNHNNGSKGHQGKVDQNLSKEHGQQHGGEFVKAAEELVQVEVEAKDLAEQGTNLEAVQAELKTLTEKEAAFGSAVSANQAPVVETFLEAPSAALEGKKLAQTAVENNKATFVEAPATFLHGAPQPALISESVSSNVEKLSESSHDFAGLSETFAGPAAQFSAAAEPAQAVIFDGSKVLVESASNNGASMQGQAESQFADAAGSFVEIAESSQSQFGDAAGSFVEVAESSQSQFGDAAGAFVEIAESSQSGFSDAGSSIKELADSSSVTFLETAPVMADSASKVFFVQSSSSSADGGIASPGETFVHAFSVPFSQFSSSSNKDSPFAAFFAHAPVNTNSETKVAVARESSNPFAGFVGEISRASSSSDHSKCKCHNNDDNDGNDRRKRHVAEPTLRRMKRQLLYNAVPDIHDEFPLATHNDAYKMMSFNQEGTDYQGIRTPEYQEGLVAPDESLVSAQAQEGLGAPDVSFVPAQAQEGFVAPEEQSFVPVQAPAEEVTANKRSIMDISTNMVQSIAKFQKDLTSTLVRLVKSDSTGEKAFAICSMVRARQTAQNGLTNFIYFLPQIISLDTEFLQETERQNLRQAFEILSEMMAYIKHDVDRGLDTKFAEDQVISKEITKLQNLVAEGKAIAGVPALNETENFAKAF